METSKQALSGCSGVLDMKEAREGGSPEVLNATRAAVAGSSDETQDWINYSLSLDNGMSTWQEVVNIEQCCKISA